MSGVDTGMVDQRSAGLTLADYVRVARIHWKGVVAFTLLTTLLAFAWTLFQPRIYAAESSGIVVTGGADNLSLSLAGDNLSKSKAKNYKSVASSRLVADRVIAALRLKTTADELLRTVNVSVPVDTADIRISASSPDPATAQRVADAWVVALADQVKDIETTTATESAAQPVMPSVRVVPLGKAVAPTSPVTPNVKIALALGALVGLLAGIGYALLRNHLDRRIRTAAEIERVFGVPVIGTIPVDHRLDEKSKVLDAGPLTVHSGDRGNHAISEALRELRTNLSFLDVDNPPRIIVVTSSVPSEGKSTVTANLAVTMAAAGENVVVVDGDLRRPTVVDVFGLVPGVGVTDVLSGQASVEDVLQPWGALPNLAVLGSGRIPPNPSELLGSRAMKNLLAELSHSAVVLIDAPPLLPVTDAAVLSRISDGAIVVVRAGRTTQEQLGKSLGNLNRVRGHVLGTILNYVPTTGADAYAYYGTYGSKNQIEAVVPDAKRVGEGFGERILERARETYQEETDFEKLLFEPDATTGPHVFAPVRSGRRLGN